MGRRSASIGFSAAGMARARQSNASATHILDMFPSHDIFSHGTCVGNRRDSTILIAAVALLWILRTKVRSSTQELSPIGGYGCLRFAEIHLSRLDLIHQITLNHVLSLEITFARVTWFG